MFGGISYTIFWMIVAVVLGIIEAATLGLFTIWFAIGALLAVACAAVGLSFPVQIAVFIISSAVLIYFTRPIAKKWLKIGTERTNADRLIGDTGIVAEKIDVIQGKGQVKVRGQVWSAVSAGGAEIEAGRKVKILEITGVKLVVSELQDKGGDI